MGTVTSYEVVTRRFPLVSRSDGKVQMLVPNPHCRYCYKPISEEYEASGMCYDCRAEPLLRGGLPHRLVAATLYIPHVKGYEHSHEIIGLKEKGEFSNVYAEVLVKVLAQDRVDITDGVIVPIPQTTLRQGLTGPRALAAALSGLTGLPTCECLSFIRPVRSQKKLSKSEREENIRGAMSAKSWNSIGKILLVDEVMTSGATIREGTRALIAAGAQEVIGLIAGRDASLKSLEYAGVVKRVED